jgi:Mn2+/Fe2+ NRAMP family transporter
LLVANTINIAADLAAMGEAVNLVAGGPSVIYAVGFGVACLVAEIFIPYHRYAGFLKFLTLALLIYVAVAFSVDIPWGQVLRTTLLPTLSLDRDMLLMVVALLGTTISPYLFFWQASQEVEESRLSHRHKEKGGDKDDLAHISIDTWIGMAASNLVAFFIIVTTAATLHANGVTEIATAAQAAEALRPIAGDFTFLLFALGLVGTGMLAVPVLAGSAAYAVAEISGMRRGLELPPSRAPGFYGVVCAATLGGAGLATLHIDAMTLLFWTAVINGVVAVPIMLATMLVVSGDGERALTIPIWLKALGWIASALMALALLASIWSYVA